MKVTTPEISWHERDPIYSVDFQPGKWSIQRIASGGVDKIVRIWQMTLDAEGKGQIDFLSNLRRHTQTVNVVRFSRNGELLASAGDDATIILWKLNEVPAPANNIFADDDTEEDKESWVCHKTLRGHLGDVADLSWSKDNSYLVSGSVDNCAVVWDVTKGVKTALFKEHKSYVQGVAFDPLGNYIATLSADRSLRLYNMNSKNCVHNINKMTLPSLSAPPSSPGDAPNPETKPKSFRIFHDDGLRSFFRRLDFSPDGQLLIAPAGCMELGDNKIVNTSFIFARGAFSKPAVYLPSPEKSTVVARVNPQLFELRPSDLCSSSAGTTDEEPETDKTKIWEKHKSLFCLPYRMVFAVATEDSVLLYDTQQTMPIGLLKNIHYQPISDLSWTSNGKALIVSSADGFCTIVTFEDNELGVPYKEPSTDRNKAELVPSSSVKGLANGKVDGRSPEAVASANQLPTTLQSKTPKRPRKIQLKPVETSKIPPSNENNSAERPAEDCTKKDSCSTPVTALPSELSLHVSSLNLEDCGNVKGDSTAGLTEAWEPQGSDDKVKEEEMAENKPAREKEEGAHENVKKKRIQLTTISLIKK